MLSFISGLILLCAAIIFYMIVKDKIHPATVFPAVWGITLLFISMLPSIGFRPIDNGSLLIFVLGGLFFSLASVLSHLLIAGQIKIRKSDIIFDADIKPAISIILFLNCIVFFISIHEFMALGGGLFQAAYTARSMQVSGERIFSPIVTNYMLLGLIVIPLLTMARINKKINLFAYCLIVLPWAFLILLTAGRSGLIKLILALVFIYYIMVRKVSFKLILTGVFFFLFIIVLGALTTDKVTIGAHESIGQIVQQFSGHIASYAFQGPILFSQYYNGSAVVATNWSPFTSIEHIISFFGGAAPPGINLEYNSYGYSSEMVGNVYSLYFSVLPNFGILGGLLIMIGYSFLSTYFYIKARAGNLIYLLMSAYIFSAIVLSIYSDNFLTQIWFFIKLIIAVFFFKRFTNILGVRHRERSLYE